MTDPDTDYGIIELHNRVFEWRITPGKEVSGIADRELTVRLLSGPCLDLAEAVAIQREIVRGLIDAGSRVYSATFHGGDDE